MKVGLVSVIIPCYNYGNFLRDALQSVLDQTYTEWEAIVVDDGSTDNTKAVAEKFITVTDRIHYIRKENGGLSSARNSGLKQAKGEWVQFLDADDLLLKDKLELQVKKITPETAVVYGRYVFLEDASGRQWEEKRMRVKLKGNTAEDIIRNWERGLTIPIHTLLFRKDLFDRFGNFDESLRTHEDWDLHVRFSARGNAYLYTDSVGAVYRIHSSSLVKDFTFMRNGFISAALKHAADSTLPLFLRMLSAERCIDQLLYIAMDKARGRKIKTFHVLQVSGSEHPFLFFNLMIVALLLSPLYFVSRLFRFVLRKIG